MSAAALTPVELAPILREMMRDRSYVEHAGLGRDIELFKTYFLTERGKSASGWETYEYTLARLALYYADMTLEDFDGKPGTNLIRDFLRDHYSDVGGATWNGRVAHIKSFFKWAAEEERIESNPAAIVRYRTTKDSERHAHSPERIAKIVACQPERRDRIAVQLLGRMALRRNELRVVQFKHVNRDTRQLTVFGKGSTVRPLPLFDDLFEQIQREAVERLASPDEYLLYPGKLGRLGDGMGVIWEDRLRALSISGIDKWWTRVLGRASEARFPMHELRHSAGTNFWRETRDLRMTQKLMRHKSIRTTADTYLHDDAADLAEAFGSMPRWSVDE